MFLVRSKGLREFKSVAAVLHLVKLEGVLTLFSMKARVDSELQVNCV